MGFRIKYTLKNVFLLLFGLLLIYPLVWLFFASFKTNNEIFGSLKLLPNSFSWDAYINGWKGSGQFGYGVFLLNTFKLVIPTVLFTIASSSVVAYGFARFNFVLKKPLFALMISTLMLPNTVIIIPRYLQFQKLGWLNSYLPFIVPAIFACYPFFIFMLVQFFRGIPRDLDESAFLDGCGRVRFLISILLPLSKSALFSVAIFQFIWTWNDFFNTLIYIDSVKKFPLSLGLRMSMDATTSINWNQIIAMSIITIIPPVILFFFAQKHFVQGIATTGIKG
ncbi:binding-protein-dependent transport systems inner membrane component [Ruminiclostridium papyrosolvens DSM 2782]|uniref:Binding-protein-dependent transport systems inner membrane component n=1 Tax=Ruminiclostridium papyrosolvens DSM 2782 TaxID=588581 RepID=F1TF76_9FIRM|nr:carbohydrate ABC transporter permease [Ruminiclostridium papyrosolvens]EGD47014.1 binding-protein-dependent transport systems inner membrane component [Ruminiclostridium papyrosolvens DSM 2782]WES33737.1 carbohydrate ABC transporter permease [Ruminiclostridium papyrosolvens DSM 2782]